MRLRFQGDPNHLVVRLQRIPDHAEGVTRNYLVLMDGVPGGTGFLKTLFQETDSQGLVGEGVMDVMRRALDAMETCPIICSVKERRNLFSLSKTWTTNSEIYPLWT